MKQEIKDEILAAINNEGEKFEAQDSEVKQAILSLRSACGVEYPSVFKAIYSALSADAQAELQKANAAT